MNREIKFRIWDKQYREWLKRTFSDGPSRFGWYSKSHPQPDVVTFDWTLSNPDTWIIQQFTGLQDIKQKDIFEGDILKFYWKPAEFGDSEEWTGEVFWDLEWTGFLISRQGQWTIKEIRNPEIIGNVFENPDLMK